MSTEANAGTVLGVLVVAALAVASGCTRVDGDASDSAGRQRSAAGRDDEASAVTPVGVQACDQYLAALGACLAHGETDARRATLRAIFDDQARAWRASADAAGDDPAVRERLATECKSAMEVARPALQQLGCTL